MKKVTIYEKNAVLRTYPNIDSIVVHNNCIELRHRINASTWKSVAYIPTSYIIEINEVKDIPLS